MWANLSWDMKGVEKLGEAKQRQWHTQQFFQSIEVCEGPGVREKQPGTASRTHHFWWILSMPLKCWPNCDGNDSRRVAFFLLGLIVRLQSAPELFDARVMSLPDRDIYSLPPSAVGEECNHLTLRKIVRTRSFCPLSGRNSDHSRTGLKGKDKWAYTTCSLPVPSS